MRFCRTSIGDEVRIPELSVRMHRLARGSLVGGVGVGRKEGVLTASPVARWEDG